MRSGGEADSGASERKCKMRLERIENLALALTAAVGVALGGAAIVSIALLLPGLTQYAAMSWWAHLPR